MNDLGVSVEFNAYELSKCFNPVVVTINQQKVENIAIRKRGNLFYLFCL